MTFVLCPPSAWSQMASTLNAADNGCTAGRTAASRSLAAAANDSRELLLATLERFERDYNLADGTDYARLTMSAEAWTTLLDKVNAASLALDDPSLSANYGTLNDILAAQLDATDASLRLFKSYQAMSTGTRSLLAAASDSSPSASTALGGFADEAETASDADVLSAISALNAAFVAYAAQQPAPFDASVFLGGNLDFSAPASSLLNNVNNNTIYAVADWDVAYANADTWAVLQTNQASNPEKLYIRKNWGSAATMLTATKQLMLPEGNYRLSLSWNSNMRNMVNLSCLMLDDARTTIGKATSRAETLNYEFALNKPTPVDLVIGFRKTGTGNTPAQIVADDIVLTHTADYVAPGVATSVGSSRQNHLLPSDYYDLQGHHLRSSSPHRLQPALSPGVYILRGKKVVVPN